MAFRIPVELQEVAKAFDLKRWTKPKSFPRDAYYETIDDFRAALKRFDPDDEVNKKHLATMLAATIATEGALETHALATSMEIGNAEKWTQVCTAAAWVIMQAYETAVTKGEWPK
ncbi:hypothetical protein [Kineococcus rubinsiae]|uniref:hypothetical protein n=1 Tax=Kineococcus rubinsiae TaxID=2609562 RepID=UPI00142F63A3|nr:hypothetical protein [Kineococcus rubinsiae]NIZ91564.1 hypothetical protein [Kineococcus rubinsiae]